ncbi:MAG: methyltransferase domain-containing protein [bacterium]|nr:methyltransferase domain-containing protein [bacterium]
MKLEEFVDYLVCPATNQKLALEGDSSARRSELAPVSRTNGDLPVPQSVGVTDRILVCSDTKSAYPVIDDIPVLMVPEQLRAAAEVATAPPVDLRDLKYAEAYEEMEFYNARRDEAGDDVLDSIMAGLTGHPDIPAIAETFPKPHDIWLDAIHDSLGQLEAYEYLAPLKDKVFLQLGGSGSHSVKSLLAGGKQAFLLTPMIGEARFAMRLAERFGVADRMACVLAVGEELPFAKDSIDIVFSGGCFHHMSLGHVADQLQRVLTTGGKFAGSDPWKTLLHTVGTRVIGKRETSIFCKPITPERLAPMQERFPGMLVSQHGPLLRYFFLGLSKARIEFSLPTMMRIMRIDDQIGRAVGLRKHGGSLVIAGTKEG